MIQLGKTNKPQRTGSHLSTNIVGPEGKDDGAAVFGYAPPRHWCKCSSSAAMTYLARTPLKQAAALETTRLRFATWDQNQHWTLELSADQTPATS